MATASCRSAITYIDGEKGILEYRGYPIEQLAERSSYLEVAYLLVHGELPTQPQLDEWVHHITIHTFVHENVKEFMQGFRYDAHPMGMLLASVGALSTFYPEASQIHDHDIRYIQVIRLLAKMPTLAAFAFRHNQGKPYARVPEAATKATTSAKRSGGLADSSPQSPRRVDGVGSSRPGDVTHGDRQLGTDRRRAAHGALA